MNSVLLIGRLTKDIDLRYTSNTQKAVSSFTLAVDGLNKTNWIRCQVWDKQAEAMEKYGKKGSRVGITGRLENRDYEKDGVKVQLQEVIVERVEFLDKRESEEQGFQQIQEQLPF